MASVLQTTSRLPLPHLRVVFQAKRMKKGDDVRRQKPLHKNSPFYLGRKVLDRNFFYLIGQYCTMWLPLELQEVAKYGIILTSIISKVNALKSSLVNSLCPVLLVCTGLSPYTVLSFLGKGCEAAHLVTSHFSKENKTPPLSLLWDYSLTCALHMWYI